MFRRNHAVLIRTPKRCKEVYYVDLGERFHISILFAKIGFDAAGLPASQPAGLAAS